MGGPKKIYLATAYSHPDKNVRAWRFEQINRAAGILMQKGHIVFSPISHSHPISLHIKNSLDHDFWMKQDTAFLDWADIMVVAKFKDDPVEDATGKSLGVNYEIGYMENLGKQVVEVFL